MPTYCTDGQTRRKFQRLSASVDFDKLHDCRIYAKDVIDEVLGVRYSLPFSPWLRVKAMDGGTAQLYDYDSGFVVVGNIVGYYDNSEKKFTPIPSTVATSEWSTASGVWLVAGSPALDCVPNDELAVRSTFNLTNGGVGYVYGPPATIQSYAAIIAAFNAHMTITDLPMPNDFLVAEMDRVMESLDLLAQGKRYLIGASPFTHCYDARGDYEQAINVDDPGNWAEADGLIDDIESERD